ncbi:hypothetical protein [Phenylobacterium sp.]|jgi:hypothetical protein|uniref:hypothetical protein n=1 Tax=Phenylobacterium sp. TaxID=1871053 RepID=UPI0011F6970A|nr:hypothetical protein [Phenylobacterium sp.]THD54424.1 MAG: hypothetical protein E8A12_17085 [Phenylobacterium sp.]
MADPTRFYAGWLVDPDGRAALLARVPPRYAVVVAHHVTLKFGDVAAVPPAATVGEIVGEADDGAGVQVLVVAIEGSPARPDGGTFHITWSLAPGREARESNDVIALRGWTPISAPIPVRLIPKA